MEIFSFDRDRFRVRLPFVLHIIHQLYLSFFIRLFDEELGQLHGNGAIAKSNLLVEAIGQILYRHLLHFLLRRLILDSSQQELQSMLLLDFLDRENDPELFEVLLDFLKSDRCLVDLFLRLLFEVVFFVIAWLLFVLLFLLVL